MISINSQTMISARLNPQLSSIHLQIITEKSKSVSYSASEIISIKEKIFDQKLSFVDAYANLNRLSLEVFHLHSIYPLLIGLGINKEGDIE